MKKETAERWIKPMVRVARAASEIVWRWSYRGLTWPPRVVCGVLYGHDLRGDRGYGGGDMMDVHCSICDKLQKVPAREDSWGEWAATQFGQVLPPNQEGGV